MSYARTVAPEGPLDPIDLRQPSRLGERKLSDGRTVRPPAGDPWTDDLAALCGFERIVTTARPADTATDTSDLTIQLADGPALVAGMTQVPTQVWTVRPKTAAELADDQAEQDRQDRAGNLSGAIATLRAWADDAASTNVTNGNNNTVTQVLVDRLGTFFDRFADLLENQGYG